MALLTSNFTNEGPAVSVLKVEDFFRSHIAKEVLCMIRKPLDTVILTRSYHNAPFGQVKANEMCDRRRILVGVEHLHPHYFAVVWADHRYMEASIVAICIFLEVYFDSIYSNLGHATRIKSSTCSLNHDNI